MTTVRDLIAHKGHAVYSVRPEDSVYTALELMAEKNIGAVLVIDEEGKLRGVLSERDYARKVVLLGQRSRETLAGEIMTDKVVCISPEKRAEDAMALMTTHRFRHLPVIEDGRLLGVVSIGDVGRAIIADQGHVIQQLERYICAG